MLDLLTRFSLTYSNYISLCYKLSYWIYYTAINFPLNSSKLPTAHTNCLQHTLIAYSTQWLLIAHADCLQHTLIGYSTHWLLTAQNDCLQHTMIAYITHWLLTAHADFLHKQWLLTTHSNCLRHTLIAYSKQCFAAQLRLDFGGGPFLINFEIMNTSIH